jgi:phage FluMu protein Com
MSTQIITLSSSHFNPIRSMPRGDPSDRIAAKLRTCSFCGKFFADLLQTEDRGWVRHIWKRCPRCRRRLDQSTHALALVRP